LDFVAHLQVHVTASTASLCDPAWQVTLRSSEMG